MKKLALSVITMCYALLMAANPISRQAALCTAKNYMLAKGKIINEVQMPFKAQQPGAVDAKLEEAYYYVFNAGNNEGYVIVSGDDRTEPILGYVEQGNFDPENIPENMRSWLQLYADQIKYIVDNNLDANSVLLKKRNKVIGTKRSVGEILTTRWNQGSPYNITCPKYYKEDGTQDYPATGCTATAMAQVMNFYKYPAQTKIQIPAHSNTYTLNDGTKKTVTASPIPAKTPIDWENMRDTYSWENGHVANAQDSAVANLMRYCGQAVKMGWGPSSGANFSAEAYIKYFGFDNSAYVGERRDYSIDDWFDMLYNEIEQGYPVLFSGFSSGGGHAFVLDGFDGDNLFHLNWGWGGGRNGWFLVSILNPGDNSGIGASSSSDGYSMGQRALFNLRLPDTNNADTYLFIKDVAVSNKTSIKATFENKTGASGNFNTAIVRYDEDGNIALVGNQQTITSMANKSSQTKTFVIKGKLPEGTHKLSPASKPARSTEWRPKYNMRNHYIEAVVDSTGELTLTPVDISTGNDISIDTITFPGTRIVGKEQEVKVTFRNNGNEYFREVHFFASKTQEKVYTDCRSMVAVRKGETVEVSYFFKPEETGTYNLWFCTSSNGSGEVGKGTMDIITEAEAVKANLSVSSYTISNAVSGTAYGKRLVGKANIKNNKTVDFHGSIKIQIWTQYGGSGSAWSGSSRTYSMDIAAGKIASVEFEFDNLDDGNKYYLRTSYVNQDGDLGKGGVWDSGGWPMKSGILLWKADGTVSGKASATSLSAGNTTCGFYANGTKISRLNPNKTNPNAIYVFDASMDIPRSLDTTNAVRGKHAERIKFVNDKPYYIPTSFEADSATFTYTFADTENGTAWHAFTMPFDADSISLDGTSVTLNDSTNHFWIYEFAAQSENGEVIFAPTTKLRGSTAYIIAADATMAGRSLEFSALGASFQKTGSDKMVVSSPKYKFHGNTYSPKVKDCYILNEDGTAFEYTTTATALTGMAPYFTTTLSEADRPASIVLPSIPKAQVREIVLDEQSADMADAGNYDVLTLKRTFDAGWNTICLPFQIDNVQAVFGEGAQAYAFIGIDGEKLAVCQADTTKASVPYVVYLPAAITDDIVLKNIQIDEASTISGMVECNSAFLRGTYAPIAGGEWTKAESTNLIYCLNADGTVSTANEATGISGYRAYFEVPQDKTVTTVGIYNLGTGIEQIQDTNMGNSSWYSLVGYQMKGKKPSTGIYIKDGKKVIFK